MNLKHLKSNRYKAINSNCILKEVFKLRNSEEV